MSHTVTLIKTHVTVHEMRPRLMLSLIASRCKLGCTLCMVRVMIHGIAQVMINDNAHSMNYGIAQVIYISCACVYINIVCSNKAVKID